MFTLKSNAIFSPLRGWSGPLNAPVNLPNLFLIRFSYLRLIEVQRIARENKKLSYCLETVRRESMPRIAEMDVEMTT